MQGVYQRKKSNILNRNDNVQKNIKLDTCMQPKKNKISGPYMSTLPNDEITNYFLSYIFLTLKNYAITTMRNILQTIL